MLARQLETWELGNDRNFTALRVLVFEKLSAYTDLLSRPFEGSGTWVRLRLAFIVMTVGLGADVTALELVGNGGTEAAGDTARSLARHSLHKYPCGGGFIVSEEKEPADGRADGGIVRRCFRRRKTRVISGRERWLTGPGGRRRRVTAEPENLYYLTEVSGATSWGNPGVIAYRGGRHLL